MSAVPHQLAEWFERRGYTLVPAQRYECFEGDHVVTFRPGDARQSKLQGLLHEAGHVLIGEALKRSSCGGRFSWGYPYPRRGKCRPAVSAVDLVHEEIEAWHRGWSLGRRLRLRVNEPAYWSAYGRCVAGYLRAAVRRSL